MFSFYIRVSFIQFDQVLLKCYCFCCSEKQCEKQLQIIYWPNVLKTFEKPEMGNISVLQYLAAGYHSNFIKEQYNMSQAIKNMISEAGPLMGLRLRALRNPMQPYLVLDRDKDEN